jgi:NADH-quinone oxidoreductase subunit F
MRQKKGPDIPVRLNLAEVDMKDEMRVLMSNMDKPGQTSIETYEKNGGYEAARKALSSIKPAELVEMVLKSELRGRGGAGFPTGRKWGFIPKDPALAKYLVCNCDESEPGTFKDRLLIEKDPHQLIEGMILASYAIGAEQAFIYCRGEFFEGFRKLQTTVAEAKSKGYLGKNIFGSNERLGIEPRGGRRKPCS